MIRDVAGAAVLLAVAPALAGCSFPTSTAMYPTASGAPPTFAVATSQPADGSIGLPRNAPLTVTFTDFPDPSTIAFPNVILTSGPDAFDAIYAVDLVAKALVVTPRATLAPGTRYVLHLTRDVSSLAGAPLASDVLLGFTTAEETGGQAPAPTPRTFARDVGPLLYDLCARAATDGGSAPVDGGAPPSPCTCAQGGCHAAPTPAAGLDLTSPTIAARSLADLSTEHHLARVSPGDPASSYLLRKLLGTPDIAGARMPLGGPYLDEAALRVISDWIAEGAP